MSEKTPKNSETPKAPSKFVQKLNKLKPSTMDDEKKATVANRIKMIGAYTLGVATALAAVAAVTSYVSIEEDEENAEVEESEETTED